MDTMTLIVVAALGWGFVATVAFSICAMAGRADSAARRTARVRPARARAPRLTSRRAQVL
ncbi:MAG: hypothetical protein QOK31_1901 [Solirubrobacteraceae bacterium]|nr:hypothetical protein [Solirubrobacteraceae bacterium]